MRTRILSLFALALFGCGESTNDDIVIRPVDPSVGQPLTAEFNIRDKFGQEARTFVVGDEIHFEILVANDTDEAVTYYTNGPGYDVIVEHLGVEVWSAFFGFAFPAVIDEHVLEAGETLSLCATWNGVDNDGAPVGGGGYVVIPVIGFGLADDSAAVLIPEPVGLELN